jgi:hypothetical protein
MQPVMIQGIDQGLQNVGLADHFTEQARTPFTGKYLITHWMSVVRSDLKASATVPKAGRHCEMHDGEK